MKHKKGSGGRRKGAGRPPTPGDWIKFSTKLEVETVQMLQWYAMETGVPQNHFLNDLVKAHFKRITPQ